MLAATSKGKEQNTGKKFYKNYCFEDVKNFLLERFLLDNDVDSMNILLNSYNIEDSIQSITPSYISLKSLRRDILTFLKNREGKELIARNISAVIHDDINRFELTMYLEGYRAGFTSKEYVNKVETLAYQVYELEDLYSSKKLFKKSLLPDNVRKLKEKIFFDIDRMNSPKKNIRDVVRKLDSKLLRKKIYMMNSFLDRQLMFSFYKDNKDEGFVDLGTALTREELYGLNKKIVKFLLRDGLRVYKNAYWDGVNDRVLKRYK